MMARFTVSAGDPSAAGQFFQTGAEGAMRALRPDENVWSRSS
jgi:hypothetical protein